MSVFRLIKYSSIIYFLGRHKSKLFRSVAVLLFAFVTTLLYDDVRVYLESQHPDTLLYALGAKILIVYGSLAFVLWQFRGAARERSGQEPARVVAAEEPQDRLSSLADVDAHVKLKSRYDRILDKKDR